MIMNEDQILQRMHALELDEADELMRICKKHSITCFMIGGTQLGAIRHKGFIPWDDDMDFAMFRPDFERFCQVAPGELNGDKYYFQNMMTDHAYPYNFAKIRLKGTHVRELFALDSKAMDGIYIDIFPMDSVPDNAFEKKLRFGSFFLFRNLMWVKLGYGSAERKKRLSTRVTAFFARLMPAGFIRRMKHVTISGHKGRTEKVVCSDGTYGLERETVKRAWFEDITMYPFEDRLYPGTAQYDEYLTHLYKDYMQLPPADKRNHHDRISVDFGPYTANE